MKQCRAFTIVEMLVVLAIIMVLAGLLQPTYTAARHSANIQSSASRLRQLSMAVQIYRINEDLYGYSIDQFPPRDTVYESYLGLGIDFFRSPCGYKDGIEDNLKRISYSYGPFDDPFVEAHFLRYQDNAVLFLDPHCHTLAQWSSPYLSKRNLSVLVEGRLVNEMKKGLPRNLSWWLPRDLENTIP